nr:MCE family protein [Mycobacterium sp.]
MIGRMADGIVGIVKAGHRQKAWLSALALLVTLLVGLAYVTFGALRWNPLKGVYHVNVQLPASGGLLANQDVTLRGIQIGKIEHLALTPDGVDAMIKINDGVELSESSKARVAGLSAAGE